MIIPEWVLFMFDLSKPSEKVWNLSKSKNKSLRENIRKFRQHNYSYTITRDPAQFEYFYNQMYLPYVEGRFGEITAKAGFRQMERIFEKGQILLVKKGNEYVSGGVVRVEGNTVFFPFLGILGGKLEYLKGGALTALYYFTILWAKETGCKWLDFGHCRSFLKDGVFNYKKHWGMEIKISRRYRNIFGMKICNVHQGVQSFLEKDPFIFIDQEKLKGLIFIDDAYPLPLEEVESLLMTHSISGLDSLLIVSPKGYTKQAEEFAKAWSTQKVQLINTKADVFFRDFPVFFAGGKLMNNEKKSNKENLITGEIGNRAKIESLEA